MTDPRDAEAWADWVTIWQSEFAALAADRELQDAMQRAAALWAAEALTLEPQHEARSPGAPAPPRPTPAPAPPGHDAPAHPGAAAAD